MAGPRALSAAAAVVALLLVAASSLAAAAAGDAGGAASDDGGVAVGIDLGTTFSVVAAYNAAFGTVNVLPSATGASTTPSVVAVAPSDVHGREILVGTAAQNQQGVNPEQTFHSLKRIIGRHIDHPDVAAHKSNVAYQVHSEV